MTDALHVILALFQVILIAASLAAIIYVQTLRRELDSAVSKCNECAGNAKADAYSAVTKSSFETSAAVEKCLAVAKVLEATHNANIEAIKRLDAKLDDVNHKMIATNMRNPNQGRM